VTTGVGLLAKHINVSSSLQSGRLSVGLPIWCKQGGRNVKVVSRWRPKCVLLLPSPYTPSGWSDYGHEQL